MSGADRVNRRIRPVWASLTLSAAETQPARAPDVEVLKVVKEKYESNPDLRPPPILVVVTHIDELTPALEWSPPYDLLQADRPKARRIREAIDHVGYALGLDHDVLGIDHDQIVPVCVREIHAAYNIDLLWTLVAANLNEARFVKLARVRPDANGLSVAQMLSQFATGGDGLPMQCGAEDSEATLF